MFGFHATRPKRTLREARVHCGNRVCPRADDVRAAAAELNASGVTLLSDVVDEPSGLRYAYVAAPDGVVIELTEY